MSSSRVLISRLPRFLKGLLFRNRLRLQDDIAPSMWIGVAKTQSDLESAFRLVHDSYVESGFMKPDPSGLRITKYHCLPTTTVLCVKSGGEVVATATVIQDSPFGLPMDGIFDMSAYRKGGKKLAEISSLAIAPTFRGAATVCLFPLTKFIHNYCDRYLKLNYMVCAVNPKHQDLYEAILLFKKIGQATVAKYNFANNQPAVGHFFDLNRDPHRFAKIYSGKPKHRDLFRYFYQKSLSILEFPNRAVFRGSDPTLTPELMHYFFNQRVQLFQQLTAEDMGYLQVLFGNTTFGAVLPGGAQSSSRFPSRRETRHPITLRGVLFPLGIRPKAIKIRDISPGGFQAVLESGGLRVGCKMMAELQIGRRRTVRLSTTVRWNKDGLTGFSVENAPDEWSDFLQQAGQF